jgi:hypothetical protein
MMGDSRLTMKRKKSKAVVEDDRKSEFKGNLNYNWILEHENDR